MKIKSRKPILVHITKSGKSFLVKYKNTIGKSQTLHILANNEHAQLYAEGVVDGIELAQQLLRVNRTVGKQKQME